MVQRRFISQWFARVNVSHNFLLQSAMPDQKHTHTSLFTEISST